MTHTYVVTGAGPVGSTIASRLATAGHAVRLLTRRGTGPEHPLIERRRLDVANPAGLADALEGARAVFHCIHGSAYTAKAWRAELPAAEQVVLAAAGDVGAVVVFPESLYAYGEVDSPITETMPRTATAGKLGVRADLLRARQASATSNVSVAASDFYGPGVLSAHAGERMVPTVLARKRIRVVGDLDAPHSFTFVPDLAAAMIRAADTPELWNTVLHAPTAAPVTQRELIQRIARAAGVAEPPMSAIPVWALRTAGLVSSEARELAETGYMFDRPFVLDSSASEARLQLTPTPLDEGIAATVAWWQQRLAANGRRDPEADARVSH